MKPELHLCHKCRVSMGFRLKDRGCHSATVSNCSGCGSEAPIRENNDWNRIHAPLKDDLREELLTARNELKQSRHDAEVKERCYQTLLKQCVDAECKLVTLTALIDEVILCALSDELKSTVNEEMQRLDV